MQREKERERSIVHIYYETKREELHDRVTQKNERHSMKGPRKKAEQRRRGLYKRGGRRRKKKKRLRHLKKETSCFTTISTVRLPAVFWTMSACGPKVRLRPQVRLCFSLSEASATSMQVVVGGQHSRGVQFAAGREQQEVTGAVPVTGLVPTKLHFDHQQLVFNPNIYFRT